MVPGMQDKNSKPPKPWSFANSDRDLSVTAAPAIIISLDKREIFYQQADLIIKNENNIKETIENIIKKIVN